jgi:hypothetical protein
MPELVLHSYTPEPLMSYLKTLGPLELVAKQTGLEARVAAFFSRHRSSIRTRGDRRAVGGGSGFVGQDNRKAIDTIAASSVLRLQDYCALIGRV